MTDLPTGGRTVLENIARGLSPWHGWEAGQPARTPEGQAAYADRAHAITACRERGLVTDENLLTETGRAAVRMLEAAFG